MAITVDFNTKDIQKLSKQMNELHRSSFPVVVRQTLNNTAFDVKKYELLKSAGKNFTIRNQNFFKKFSKVQMASGFNINQMHALVGMEDKPESQNFHEQEVGGTIRRVAIPNDMARTGRAQSKRIAKRHYLQNNAIIDQSKKSRRRPNKSQRVADYYMAHKKGLWLLKNETLFKVNTFRKTKKRIRIKLTPLYSVKIGRKVTLTPRGFIEEAAVAAAPRMKRHFKVAVNKQFKKYFK